MSSNVGSPISLDGSPNIDSECSVSKQPAESEKSNDLVTSSRTRSDEQMKTSDFTDNTVLNGRGEEGMCHGLIQVYLPEMPISHYRTYRGTMSHNYKTILFDLMYCTSCLRGNYSSIMSS